MFYLCSKIFLLILFLLKGFELTKEDSILFNHEKEKYIGDKCERKIDGALGTCVLDKDCENADLIYKKYGIRPDICEFHNHEAIICCSEKNLYNQIEEKDQLNDQFIDRIPNGISVHKCLEYSFIDKHLKEVVSVDGQKPLSEFPHIAAIGWKLDHHILWNCSGSLISERFVLTSAQCTVKHLGKPDIVKFGQLDLKQIIRGFLPQVYSIIEIIKHPKYKIGLNYNDIALLRLDKTVEFTDFVRPSCLWQTFYLNHTFGTVFKWDEKNYDEHDASVISQINVDFYDNEQCEYYFHKIHDFHETRDFEHGILSSHICAGDSARRQDICHPIHGAPLQIKMWSHNKFIYHIIGLTSFNRFCGSFTPGVYTRVSTFIDWIESIVWPNQ